MTILEALRQGQAFLAQKRAETPFLDAVLLLGVAAEMSKERIFAAFGDSLEPLQYVRFQALLMDRASGIPVAYLRGRKEFQSLDFQVHAGVFIPRPATETLVAAALDQARAMAARRAARRLAVHDACTGSGCVAIAVKHEMPAVEVSCSDISEEALETCRCNALRLLGEVLPCRRSDMLAAVDGPFDLITANPPYLTDAVVDSMKGRGWPEPDIALRGGRDGLDLCDRLIEQARVKLLRSGILLMEADPRQMPSLESAMKRAGYVSIRILEDMRGHRRVIHGSVG